jgi:hypothetical protein
MAGLRPSAVCTLSAAFALLAAWSRAGTFTEVTAYPCTPVPATRDTPLSRCAQRRADGGFRVLKPALRALEFDDAGLSVIAIAGDLFWVDRSGRTARALPFDNGADPFVEGLARTLRAGKVGFIDRRLVEVIPATWDFAFPFEKGVAIVCRGCAPVADGEHSPVAGGAWGYINRRGQVVVGVEHAREALPPPPGAR